MNSLSDPIIAPDEEEAFLLKEEEDIPLQLRKLNRNQWWILVFISIFFIISANSTAILLGRFYFKEGGNSKWMATLVQTAGFPILYLPLHLLPPSPQSSSLKTLVLIYLSLGLLIGFNTLLFSFGLMFLSASTNSILSATQLVFSAVFSFFINSQKATVLILISVLYILGCLCAVSSALIYSLQLSLMQYSFEKILKRETFSMVIEMQIYTSLVASSVSLIGLFASGEWKILRLEFQEFHQGQVIYVLTLVGTAVSWQLSTGGAFALIFLVSSLFSNLVSTLSLSVTPVAAIFVFHEKLTDCKMVAMICAFVGFGFYIYQNYLDDLKVQREKESQED